jgi:hypothetical protein
VIWFHRIGAILWTLMIIPSMIWWKDAVWLVIIASLYANIKSDWGAAEAADDRQVLECLRQVLERLDELEQKIDQIREGKGDQEVQ